MKKTALIIGICLGVSHLTSAQEACDKDKIFKVDDIVYLWDGFDNKWKKGVYKGLKNEEHTINTDDGFVIGIQGDLTEVLSQSEFDDMDPAKGQCAVLTTSYREEFRKESLQLLNDYRTKNQATALQTDAVLEKAAQDYADWLVKNQKFGHREDGTTVEARVLKAARALDATILNDEFNGDYAFKGVGENLTQGRLCAFDAFESWRTSKMGHDANMKRATHRNVGYGLGCAVDQNGHRFIVAAQVFGGERAQAEASEGLATTDEPDSANDQKYSSSPNTAGQPKTTPPDAPNTAENIAYGKKAMQSSTLVKTPVYAEASNAVDGNTSTKWAYNESNTITHTNPSTNPWWQVDLEVVHQISEIKIWNRTDCCWEDINDFFVIISGKENDPNKTILGPFSFSGPEEKSKSIKVEGVNGQHILIFTQGTNKRLTLAEVEVFGSKP